jgi:hypothetical protein
MKVVTTLLRQILLPIVAKKLAKEEIQRYSSQYSALLSAHPNYLIQ